MTTVHGVSAAAKDVMLKLAALKFADIARDAPDFIRLQSFVGDPAPAVNARALGTFTDPLETIESVPAGAQMQGFLNLLKFSLSERREMSISAIERPDSSDADLKGSSYYVATDVCSIVADPNIGFRKTTGITFAVQKRVAGAERRLTFEPDPLSGEVFHIDVTGSVRPSVPQLGTLRSVMNPSDTRTNLVFDSYILSLPKNAGFAHGSSIEIKMRQNPAYPQIPYSADERDYTAMSVAAHIVSVLRLLRTLASVHLAGRVAIGGNLDMANRARAALLIEFQENRNGTLQTTALRYDGNNPPIPVDLQRAHGDHPNNGAALTFLARVLRHGQVPSAECRTWVQQLNAAFNPPRQVPAVYDENYGNVYIEATRYGFSENRPISSLGCATYASFLRRHPLVDNPEERPIIEDTYNAARVELLRIYSAETDACMDVLPAHELFKPYRSAMNRHTSSLEKAATLFNAPLGLIAEAGAGQLNPLIVAWRQYTARPMIASYLQFDGKIVEPSGDPIVLPLYPELVVSYGVPDKTAKMQTPFIQSLTAAAEEVALMNDGYARVILGELKAAFAQTALIAGANAIGQLPVIVNSFAGFRDHISRDTVDDSISKVANLLATEQVQNSNGISAGLTFAREKLQTLARFYATKGTERPVDADASLTVKNRIDMLGLRMRSLSTSQDTIHVLVERKLRLIVTDFANFIPADLPAALALQLNQQSLNVLVDNVLDAARIEKTLSREKSRHLFDTLVSAFKSLRALFEMISNPDSMRTPIINQTDAYIAQTKNMADLQRLAYSLRTVANMARTADADAYEAQGIEYSVRTTVNNFAQSVRMKLLRALDLTPNPNLNANFGELLEAWREALRAAPSNSRDAYVVIPMYSKRAVYTNFFRTFDEPTLTMMSRQQNLYVSSLYSVEVADSKKSEAQQIAIMTKRMDDAQNAFSKFDDEFSTVQADPNFDAELLFSRKLIQNITQKTEVHKQRQLRLYVRYCIRFILKSLFPDTLTERELRDYISQAAENTIFGENISRFNIELPSQFSAKWLRGRLAKKLFPGSFRRLTAGETNLAALTRESLGTAFPGNVSDQLDAIWDTGVTLNPLFLYYHRIYDIAVKLSSEFRNVIDAQTFRTWIHTYPESYLAEVFRITRLAFDHLSGVHNRVDVALGAVEFAAIETDFVGFANSLRFEEGKQSWFIVSSKKFKPLVDKEMARKASRAMKHRDDGDEDGDDYGDDDDDDPMGVETNPDALKVQIKQAEIRALEVRKEAANNAEANAREKVANQARADAIKARAEAERAVQQRLLEAAKQETANIQNQARDNELRLKGDLDIARQERERQLLELRKQVLVEEAKVKTGDRAYEERKREQIAEDRRAEERSKEKLTRLNLKIREITEEAAEDERRRASERHRESEDAKDAAQRREADRNKKAEDAKDAELERRLLFAQTSDRSKLIEFQHQMRLAEERRVGDEEREANKIAAETAKRAYDTQRQATESARMLYQTEKTKHDTAALEIKQKLQEEVDRRALERLKLQHRIDEIKERTTQMVVESRERSEKDKADAERALAEQKLLLRAADERISKLALDAKNLDIEMVAEKTRYEAKKKREDARALELSLQLKELENNNAEADSARNQRLVALKRKAEEDAAVQKIELQTLQNQSAQLKFQQAQRDAETDAKVTALQIELERLRAASLRASEDVRKAKEAGAERAAELQHEIDAGNLKARRDLERVIGQNKDKEAQLQEILAQDKRAETLVLLKTAAVQVRSHFQYIEAIVKSTRANNSAPIFTTPQTTLMRMIIPLLYSGRDNREILIPDVSRLLDANVVLDVMDAAQLREYVIRGVAVANFLIVSIHNYTAEVVRYGLVIGPQFHGPIEMSNIESTARIILSVAARVGLTDKAPQQADPNMANAVKMHARARAATADVVV
jgi:hypothetical protein